MGSLDSEDVSLPCYRRQYGGGPAVRFPATQFSHSVYLSYWYKNTNADLHSIREERLCFNVEAQLP
jgi:hypothetical protein